MKKRYILLVLAILTMMTTPLVATKIGVLWYTKSVMAERVFAGFEERIKKLAPDMDIELQASIEDLDTVNEVYTRFASEKDAIIFLRSHGAQYLVNHPIDKPGFIGAANNPVDLGVVTALNAAPQHNITGVSYYLNIDQKMKVFMKIFPEMKSVGLLLWEEHPATPIEWEGTEMACNELGVSLEAKVCTSEAQVLESAKELAGKVDVIIISSANKITDETKAIIEAAGDTPVVSYAENSVKAGALAGLVADDTKLGHYLAESVNGVLMENLPIADVPVRYDKEPVLLINKSTMLKYEVKIPQALLDVAKFVD